MAESKGYIDRSESFDDFLKADGLLEETEATALKQVNRRRRVVAATAILAALAVLLALGTWQVQRLAWKEGLLADIAARRAVAPVTLAGIETMEKSGADIEYRRVSVSGVFDHAGERHFFATFEGRTGFYVYTPLILADSRILLVNRGFVPYEMKEPQTRTMGQVAGAQAITGHARARLVAKPSWLVPENDLAKNIFYWKDWGAMVSSAGLDASKVLPFFVDADASVENPGGWPKGGVTQFDLPNSHLAYALTWYGLAAALVALVLARLFRRQGG